MQEKGGSNEQTKQPLGENMSPIPTDYMTKYSLSQDQFQKMKEKFSKKEIFNIPSTDAEREFVTD